LGAVHIPAPAPQTPTLSVPLDVVAGAAGSASVVAADPAMNYDWQLQNATLTSATRGASITFTAGSVGVIIYTVNVSNADGVTAAPAGDSTTVVSAVPSAYTPIVDAPPLVAEGQSHLIARLRNPLPQFSYAWGATGAGTLGTASSDGTSIPFSVTSGTFTITLTATNTLVPAVPLVATATVATTPDRGFVRLVAGAPGGVGFRDGPAAQARFGSYPSHGAGDILAAPSGVLYVIDQNTVRQIGTDGSVATLAGSPRPTAAPGTLTDGTGSAAVFAEPHGIAQTSAGLFVGDYDGATVLREIDVSGAVSSIATSSLPPNYPVQHLAASSSGTLLGVYANYAGNSIYEISTSDGSATSLSVCESPLAISAYADSFVVALQTYPSTQFFASFTAPGTVSVLPSGSCASPADTITIGAFDSALWLAAGGVSTAYALYRTSDTDWFHLVKVGAPEIPLAGHGPDAVVVDGVGAQAAFAGGAIAFLDGGDPSLFVFDAGAIRRVSDLDNAVGATVATFSGVAAQAGDADAPPGQGAQARFSAPGAIAVDAADNIFVADNGNGKLKKIAPDGSVTTLFGNGVPGISVGPPAIASLAFVRSMVALPNGDLLLHDGTSSGGEIIERWSASSGELSFVSNSGVGVGYSAPSVSISMFIGPDGAVYAGAPGAIELIGNGEVSLLYGNEITGIGLFTTAFTNRPLYGAVAPSGDFFVLDEFTLDRVSGGIGGVPASGQVIAGTVPPGNTPLPIDDGPCASAVLSHPSHLQVMRDGSLVFIDGSEVRRVTHPEDSACAISLLAGSNNPAQVGFGEGALPGSLNQPVDLAISAGGDVIVLDSENLVARVRP
jgi:hypothetical protein